jgi:hypothetical protein
MWSLLLYLQPIRTCRLEVLGKRRATHGSLDNPHEVQFNGDKWQQVVNRDTLFSWNGTGDVRLISAGVAAAQSSNLCWRCSA